MSNDPKSKTRSTPEHIRAQLEACASAILAERTVLSSFKHKGLSGIEREEPVRRFLRAHLPGRFHVGQGAIASSETILKHQHDIIISDRDLCFMLLNTGNAQLLPIESVHVIVEVRSRDNGIAGVAKSFRAVRTLHANEGLRQLGSQGTDRGVSRTPVHTVLAYRGPKRADTLIRRLATVNAEAVSADKRAAIDFLLVMASGDEVSPCSGYLIGYSRLDRKLAMPFPHHLYPQVGQEDMDGPKVIWEGSDSFARWYAAIVNHLIGVTVYPPNPYSYLGDDVSIVPWTSRPY